jgi:hypothetical protein
MTEQPPTMISNVTRSQLTVATVCVAGWCGVLYATLSLSKLRSPWSGALCGPWGCTAPLEAIVACHLAWLLVLVPGVAAVRRFGTLRYVTMTGWGLLLAGTVGVLVLCLINFARTHCRVFLLSGSD